MVASLRESGNERIVNAVTSKDIKAGMGLHRMALVQRLRCRDSFRAQYAKQAQRTDSPISSTQQRYTRSIMSMVRTNFVSVAIKEWAGQLGRRLVDAYNLKGGWEGWAQVELALFLQERHGIMVENTTNWVTREDHVYDVAADKSDMVVTTWKWIGNNQKDDWKDSTKWARLRTSSIELKCESSYNSDKFASAVETDLHYVNTHDINDTYKPCTVFVVGVSVSPSVRAKMLLLVPAMQEYKPFEDNDLTIWWWSKEFRA